MFLVPDVNAPFAHLPAQQNAPAHTTVQMQIGHQPTMMQAQDAQFAQGAAGQPIAPIAQTAPFQFPATQFGAAQNQAAQNLLLQQQAAQQQLLQGQFLCTDGFNDQCNLQKFVQRKGCGRQSMRGFQVERCPSASALRLHRKVYHNSMTKSARQSRQRSDVRQGCVEDQNVNLCKPLLLAQNTQLRPNNLQNHSETRQMRSCVRVCVSNPMLSDLAQINLAQQAQMGQQFAQPQQWLQQQIMPAPLHQQMPVFQQAPAFFQASQAQAGAPDHQATMQLAMPTLTGPGAAMAGPQLGTALNPAAPAFQPLHFHSAAAPIVLQAQQGRAGPNDSGTTAARSAAMNAAALPAALSPQAEEASMEAEDGEIKEGDEDADEGEETAGKATGQKSAKKPLAFATITCPSEAQIEWKPGSANRVIFRGVAEMARKLADFRKKHLSGTKSAAQVTDYNAMAKHAEQVIDHIKLAEEFGWEAVGKVVENPLAANPALTKKVKTAFTDLEKERAEQQKSRTQQRFRGRGGGLGAARGGYGRQQPAAGSQTRPLGQQNAGFHPYAAGRTPRKDQLCFNCQLPGHFARDCPKQP
ncbi:MAG: hypothetical protein GY832_22840 [Chloroflexi bacterium]|nr:hypothetical protein [Chloroflexota bacterium]